MTVNDTDDFDQSEGPVSAQSDEEHIGDFDPAWVGEAKPTDTSDRDEAVSRLTKSWQEQHEKRTKTIEATLSRDRPKASAEETLLLGLVAHDAALAEILGRAEVQLAERTLALIDNVRAAVSLAKTLKEVVACRTAASRRVQDLLQAAGVLRAQRQLANVIPLRRVA